MQRVKLRNSSTRRRSSTLSLPPCTSTSSLKVDRTPRKRRIRRGSSKLSWNMNGRSSVCLLPYPLTKANSYLKCVSCLGETTEKLTVQETEFAGKKKEFDVSMLAPMPTMFDSSTHATCVQEIAAELARTKADFSAFERACHTPTQIPTRSAQAKHGECVRRQRHQVQRGHQARGVAEEEVQEQGQEAPRRDREAQGEACHRRGGAAQAGRTL